MPAGRRTLVAVKSRPLTAVIAPVLALALVASACSSGDDSASPADTPKPADKTEDPAAKSPFTGLTGGEATGRVLAVKIDNTGPAHPQAGLTKADIVYVEQVEGGLTRLMAVFSSQLPDRVGPVRSARISDLELMQQFGKPAFAYSGAQRKLLPAIGRASVFDLGQEKGGKGYDRDAGRPSPYNLFGDPKALLASAPEASPAHDIGFRFGAAPGGGKKASTVTVRYPSASVSWSWSGAKRRWRVSSDNSPAAADEGGRLSASTVVIQYVKIRPSRFHDVNGAATPLSRTIGKGQALVLRGGKAYAATWSRPEGSSGTTFSYRGQQLDFAPGQVWVALAKKGYVRAD